jgi:uncharacterized integral membrane protein
MSRSPQQQPVDRTDGLTPRRIIAVVLLFLAVLFVVQNRDDVTLQFLGVAVTARLWLTSTVLLLLGVAIGVLGSSRRSKR